MNQKTRGTREEVWEGIAQKTSGGLTKADLTLNKREKSLVSNEAKQQKHVSQH